jgi:predicted RNase H-like HicB family nuclease
MRQVIVNLGEDGYFVAECLTLPGCISQGKTRTEALSNIREATALYKEFSLANRGLSLNKKATGNER